LFPTNAARAKAAPFIQQIINIGQAASTVPQARKQIFARMYPQFYGFSPSYVTISATGF